MLFYSSEYTATANGGIAGYTGDLFINSGGISAVLGAAAAEGVKTHLPGTSGSIAIATEEQPQSIIINGISYQQSSEESPAPGFFYWRDGTALVALVGEVPAGTSAFVVPAKDTAIAFFVQAGGAFVDAIPKAEIGQDGWDFLCGLKATGEIIFNRTKGSFASFSIEITVPKADIVLTRGQLQELLKERVFFGVPFYQQPHEERIEIGQNAYSISVPFISIHAPRSEYCPLDWKKTAITSDRPPGAVTAFPSGKKLNSSISEKSRRLGDLLSDSGVSSPPILISTKNYRAGDRISPREQLEKIAAAAGGFVCYDGKQPEIKILGETTTHKVFDCDILSPYQLKANGIPGGTRISGVLLSSPWHWRAWQPDSQAGELYENNDENLGDFDDITEERKLIGHPDPEVSSPLKNIEGSGYSYRSDEEIRKFQEAARNPGSLNYSGDAGSDYQKSRYLKIQEEGIDKGDVNGETWSWLITSLDCWDYAHANPAEPFAADPIWIYTPPVFSAHWKQVKSWARTVAFDDDGYPTISQETGTTHIAPSKESSPHEAADLKYQADKLLYEAALLLAQGQDEEAATKAAEAAVKSGQADLFRSRSFPYQKITRYFYRKLSLDRPDISEEINFIGCDENQVSPEDQEAPPARYLEKEITEANSLHLIPNPDPKDQPIVIGKRERSETLVRAYQHGWYRTSFNQNISPSGATSTSINEREDLDGSPPPASRLTPKPRQTAPRRQRDEQPNQYQQYFSTPNPIDFSKSERQSVSIPGVYSITDAAIALSALCKQENLTAEQIEIDCLFRREIVPGDIVFYQGKRWEVQSTEMRMAISPGTLHCREYRLRLGSLLPISLEKQARAVCAS